MMIESCFYIYSWWTCIFLGLQCHIRVKGWFISIVDVLSNGEGASLGFKSSVVNSSLVCLFCTKHATISCSK